MNLLWLLLLSLCVGCAHIPSSLLNSKSLSLVPPQSSQLLMVYSTPKGEVFVDGLAKADSGAWKPVLGPLRANIGRNGFAELNRKKEGDGKTPAGLYKIGTSFGYTSHVKTGLHYQQATENDFWIDDVASPQYNQWVTGSTQAKSFERLKRNDDLYEYGIVIEYNTDPVVPGDGSAIFLHVWRGKNKPTAGCVSMSKKNILKVLRWLDKNKEPYIWLNP
jgi:L,D-peptidoglycan transpeptidase YkuD (ErfK/YbiS/YcfS/YnhG family)